MSYRYLHASDLGKLLGKKYGFNWTTSQDIQRIIFNKKIKNKLEESIEKLPIQVIEQTMESLNIPKKRKANENRSSVLEHILYSKKKTTSINDQNEYKYKKQDYLKTFPDVLKQLVDTEFTLEFGNVQEAKILEEQGIKKTNELHYLNFTVNGLGYKIGCRFDGPQIEIKTRKNRFLGVPEYERAQITIYMAVSKSDTWVLKEKWNNEINDHTVFFDQEFFENIKKDIHENWEKYIL
jgi:hypothetical protein